MSGDDKRAKASDGSDKYEAAVMDFLDKEMAAAQPNRGKGESSEELDALVSDLLKQVISESDKPAIIQPSNSEDMKDLLAEFPPSEEKTPLFESGSPKSPSVPQPEPPGVVPVEAARVEALKREEVQPDAQASTPSATPMFASAGKSKSRMPVIAVVAFCLLAAGGGTAYYYLRASKGAPNTPASHSLLPAPDASAAQNQSIAVPAKPAPADAEKSASGTAKLSTSVKVQPVAKPSATVITEPAAAPVTTLSVPAPPKDERPNLNQAMPQITAVSSGTALDKLVPSSAPEKLNRPAPPHKVAATPPPVRKAAPVVSGILIPAVVISQVSPRYPEIAIQARMSAKIVLNVTIDEKGNVTRATLLSGPAIFREEAIKAVKKWRYRPASLGGVNVRSQAKVTIDFKLR